MLIVSTEDDGLRTSEGGFDTTIAVAAAESDYAYDEGFSSTLPSEVYLRKLTRFSSSLPGTGRLPEETKSPVIAASSDFKGHDADNQ
eukprot:4320300-Amphidinium_carterae.1